MLRDTERGKIRNRRKVAQSFLWATRRRDLIFIRVKLHKDNPSGY